LHLSPADASVLLATKVTAGFVAVWKLQRVPLEWLALEEGFVLGALDGGF